MSVANQVAIDAAKLRALVAAAGLSQRRVAALAGLDVGQVNRVLSGKQAALAEAAAAALAEVLLVPVDDLRRAPDTQTGANPGVMTTDVTAGYTFLALAQLVIPSLNPRRGEAVDPDAIAELAESIAEHGLLQNLVVRAAPVGIAVLGAGAARAAAPLYEVVFGGRRVRAMARLADDGRWDEDAATVACQVVTADDVEVMILGLIENIARENLSPLEEAEAFGRLQSLDDARWTARAIADRVHRSRQHVHRRLSLLRLAEPARDALRQGRLDLERAHAMAQASPQQQKDFLRRPVLPTPDSIRLSVRARQFPLSSAAFALEDYVAKAGTIVADPQGGERRFADPVLFLELQHAAVAARRAALAAAGWAWTEFQRGPIPLWQQDGLVDDEAAGPPRPAGETRGVVLWLDTAGALKEKRGLLKPPPAHAAAETPADRAAPLPPREAEGARAAGAPEDAPDPAASPPASPAADPAAAADSAAAAIDRDALAASIAADPWMALRLLLLYALDIGCPVDLSGGAGKHALPFALTLAGACDPAEGGLHELDVAQAFAWTATQTTPDLCRFLAALVADGLVDVDAADDPFCSTQAGDGVPLLPALAAHYAGPATPSPHPEAPRGGVSKDPQMPQISADDLRESAGWADEPPPALASAPAPATTSAHTETGESTASINARMDDQAWPSVKAELDAGATLLRIPKLRRGYPDRGDGVYGSGISETRIGKLERAGVLRHVGVDRYALAAPAAPAAATDDGAPPVEDKPLDIPAFLRRTKPASDTEAEPSDV